MIKSIRLIMIICKHEEIITKHQNGDVDDDHEYYMGNGTAVPICGWG
jgi:hypothetical protein